MMCYKRQAFYLFLISICEDILLTVIKINQLKKVWSQNQDDQSDYGSNPILSNAVDGSSLLFGQVRQINLTEILATLPPKTEVDKLIYQFFDHKTFPITVARKLH
jgi:hypothetical protein